MPVPVIEDIGSLQFWLAIVEMAIRVSPIFLFGVLGQIITQRSGVLNLGVEGMMLVGALIGFWVTHSVGSYWLGLLAAMIGAGMLALLLAAMCITLRASQAVVGVLISALGLALTSLFGTPLVGVPAVGPAALTIPGLSAIPVIGSVLFQQNAFLYLAFLLVPATWLLLSQTRGGLALVAVGENPQAADTLGIRVNVVRYICTVVGGMMAGMSGAYLSSAYTTLWVDGITGGRGWIVVALVIVAQWAPGRALLGALLFGGLESLHVRLQLAGVGVSPHFLAMLPYLATILVLVFTARKSFRRRTGGPRALGTPYVRGER